MIWTIGHSSLTWNEFSLLLSRNDIGTIIDVRSTPRSRFPHFNAPALRAHLNAEGVCYVPLGDALGGSPLGGPATYKDQAQSSRFISGVDRLKALMPRTRAALMCAEHEPCQCHRFLLISRSLSKDGIPIRHILRDGRVEEQSETEDRLLVRHRHHVDLFSSRNEAVNAAYQAAEWVGGGRPR